MATKRSWPGVSGTRGQGCPFATRAMVLGRTNLSERDCAAPVAGEVAELLAHELRTPLNAVRGFAELLLAAFSFLFAVGK